MSIFKREPSNIAIDNEDNREVNLVMTGENSWKVVYADRKIGAQGQKTATRSAAVENGVSLYKIYFNR
ncbi:MAG: hypothetical protein ACP5MZ_02300 [Candidatus Micrarchaeia archaeon]